MDTRRLVLIGIGVLMIVVGLAADVIGLGPNPGLGWKQIVLMVAGAVVVVGGFVIGAQSEPPDDAGGPDEN